MSDAEQSIKVVTAAGVTGDAPPSSAPSKTISWCAKDTELYEWFLKRKEMRKDDSWQFKIVKGWGVPREVAQYWNLDDFYDPRDDHTYLAANVEDRVASWEGLASVTGIMGGFAMEKAGTDPALGDDLANDCYAILIAIAISLLTSTTVILSVMIYTVRRELAHDAYLATSGSLDPPVTPGEKEGASSPVARFLASINMKEHAARFLAEDVTLSMVDDLTNDDLKDLGVSKIGHRKEISKGIVEHNRKLERELKFVRGMGANMLLQTYRGRGHKWNKSNKSFRMTPGGPGAATKTKNANWLQIPSPDLLSWSKGMFNLGMAAFLAAATMEHQGSVDPDGSWPQVVVIIIMCLPMFGAINICISEMKILSIPTVN